MPVHSRLSGLLGLLVTFMRGTTPIQRHHHKPMVSQPKRVTRVIRVIKMRQIRVVYTCLNTHHHKPMISQFKRVMRAIRVIKGY